MKQYLRRGQLAKALGSTTPTVKYYTSLGLFPIERKTAHGQYLYNFEEIKARFLQIKELKQKRLTMQEIKDRLTIESLVRD